MVAPSGITWGSVVNDGKSNAARLGIYTTLSNDTATSVTVNVEVWLWTRYAVDDITNKVYFDWNGTSASTLVNSDVDIFTTNSEWSTYNQVQLYTTSKLYTKANNEITYSCISKVSGINFIGTTLSLSKSFQVSSITKYLVSYNTNGGSGGWGSQTKYHGNDLTISRYEPTRVGYTFLGWGTSSSSTTVAYSPGETYKNNASITLYAIWEANTYTITYDANGGVGAPSSQSYQYAATGTTKLSTIEPTRTGYNFLGWSLSSTATIRTYYSGQDWLLSNASNYTLYAVWELKKYTITYNANGGLNAPNPQTKTYGVNIKLATSQPTRNGYKFLGWSTNSTSKTPTYLSGGTFTTNANITLYAIWEQLGIAYINVDGTFKAGKLWVNDYGTWMSGIVFVNDNGTWTQGGI